MVIVVEPLIEQRNSIGQDIVVVTVVKQLPRLVQEYESLYVPSLTY